MFVRRRPLSTLLLATLTACSTANDRSIAIGVAGAFSQARGVSMKLAAELARDEINRAGGIGGRPIELVFRDDSGSEDVAVRVAAEFRADRRIVAVIGHQSSGTTAAAAAIYNGDGAPLALVSPSASSPSLTEEGGRAFFRTCPTDLVHGAALARFAQGVLHARTAEVLYENNTYGRGVAGAFLADFRRLGGVAVSEDPYDGHVASFEPYLRRLQQRGGADVILIAGNSDGALRILATRDSLGLRIPVLAGDAVTGIEATGRAEGMYISSAWLADDPDPTGQRFVAAYRAAYPGTTPDHRGAGAYDVVHILARAIGAVGTDREKVVEYLEGVGSQSAAYDGVTERIAFDAQGDAKEKAVAIGVVRNKVIVSTAR